jgi:NhaA family Na+:H+ antiporter
MSGSSDRTPAATRLFATVVRPLQAFFRVEAASGLVLLGCAAVALAWANLAHDSYRLVLEAPVTVGFAGLAVRFSVLELVNDGLMTLFFFVVGMEIKRELVLGELRAFSQAILPAIAAVGGMLAPAAIFLALNAGREGAPGIPMATDIAFCIGVLTLLKARVPRALIVFVTALAIFDDIGGILVIAVFYGAPLQPGWLLAAVAVTLASIGMARAHVGNGAAWTVAGALLWYALHSSGVHATIAGVILGLAIPARPRRARLESPLGRFVRALHPWIAFGVMPLFALANSGVRVADVDASQLTGRVALGTAAALFLGKQAGIFTFALLAIRGGVARMPGGASLVKLLGVSIVAGIGFTVALFIAALAYPRAPRLLDEAKLGILAGSLLSGIVGGLLLRSTPRLERSEARSDRPAA